MWNVGSGPALASALALAACVQPQPAPQMVPAGSVQTSPAVSPSGLATETQARARLEQAGLRNVRRLRLGDDGVWRGRVDTPEGRSVHASLDARGNIWIDGQGAR